MYSIELDNETHEITLAGKNTLRVKNPRTKKMWDVDVPDISQIGSTVDLRDRRKRLQGQSRFLVPTNQFVDIVDKLCGDNCGICGTKILGIVARHRRAQARLQMKKAA